MISSNDYKLYFNTYQNLGMIIGQNIKQNSCDAGRATAATVLEVIETPVLAAEDKH